MMRCDEGPEFLQSSGGNFNRAALGKLVNDPSDAFAWDCAPNDAEGGHNGIWGENGPILDQTTVFDDGTVT